LRRWAQLSFGDRLISEEVGDLREGWMKHAYEVLKDSKSDRRVRSLGRSGI
jgi:transposase, IS5 family